MLLAEEPLCRECRRNGKTVAATEVDHIVSKERGGEDDRDNLQPLCKPCHSEKTAKEDRGFGGPVPGTALVTVVCGPPASGKSALVAERAKWGDLVVDMDRLFEALSGLAYYEKPQALLPFVTEARDAVVSRLARPSSVRRAWIVMSGARRYERETMRSRLHAKTIVLEVPTAECLKRIQRDPRRVARAKEWEPLVTQWWRDYERDDADARIVA